MLATPAISILINIMHMLALLRPTKQANSCVNTSPAYAFFKAGREREKQQLQSLLH